MICVKIIEDEFERHRGYHYKGSVKEHSHVFCSEEAFVAYINQAYRKKSKLNLKNVIFNDPATIVEWSDGTKTIVKCQKGDTYDKEKGLAMCICKKVGGNKSNFNDIFNKWIKND